jgi:disulfide bond formation protein DsbB
MQNTDSLKIIHDAVKDRFDFEIERIKLLDDKVNNLISIASILAALISGFAVLSMKLSQLTMTEIGTFVLFIASLGLLVSSLCYSIMAYQIRSYVIVPDPPSLIVECEKMNADRLLEVLYITYTLAIEENEKKNEAKVFHVKIASWLLFAAVILFAVFVFVTIATN